MSESENKRIRRSPEELVEAINAEIARLEDSISSIETKKQETAEEFDRKIDAVYAKIDALQEKKNRLLGPKPPRKPRKTKKQKMEELLRQAQKAGMKPEQIAEALGVELT